MRSGNFEEHPRDPGQKSHNHKKRDRQPASERGDEDYRQQHGADNIGGNHDPPVSPPFHPMSNNWREQQIGQHRRGDRTHLSGPGVQG
jgi:hypothetical protein